MRARGRIFSKWAWVVVASFLGVAASAETRSFPLAGGEVRLERRAEDTEVFFRALRLNRATDQWNVDVTVRNRGPRPLTGLVLLRFEAPGDTAGVAEPEGVDSEGKAFIDLTPRLAKGQLAAGAELPPFTLVLAKTARAPRVDAAVFATAAMDAVTGSVVTRTLDAAGLPLPGVTAGGVVSERGGWLTFTGGEGAAVSRFDAPGRLPVFRFAATGAGVTELPPPRLASRAADDSTLGGVKARVTPLTPQTLTAPLPLGWSPLAAAFVEFAAEPAAPVATEFTPSAAVLPGEQAVLVRWDPARPAWEVVSLVAGKGTNPVPVTLGGSGAFALVVPDAGVPAAVAGQALTASPLAPPAEQRWTATGKVMPASRPASLQPEQVTTMAQVVFRSTVGALPSGVALRCAIREEYLLRNGSRRVPPRYETFVTGHQRPGDTDAGTLTASFPLRPLLLLPGEELGEAKLTVEVLAPGTFTGRLLTPAGGTLSDGDVRLVALADVFAAPQAARLTVLAPSDLAGVATGGQALVAAFELDLAGVRAGRRLLPAFAAQTPGASFVLARTVFTEGLYGFQPVERFVSDAAGNLVSREPANGERLPGVDGGGQYLLLQAAARSALVSGVARDRAGRPAAGLAVRAGPWLAFTDPAGRYQVLAPAGISDVSISDPRTGDIGSAGVAVASDLAAVSADLDTLPHGPRVLAVAPADGAVDVPRVSSVVVTFSKPLDPASLVAPSAVQLLDTNGLAFAASVSANLARTVVTLLPTAELPPKQRLTLRLAAGLADATGLPLEGPREFHFTTQSDLLVRSDAQLVIREPVDGLALMTGGAGMAEPESPVILVNETSGFTATVLSKPDGSLANSIPAEVDDFLSVVLVNRNGTRNTLPASRQVFRDGRIGLYAGGGSLQASTEDSTVEMEIPPGSIRDKAVFRLEPLTSGQVRTLTGPTPPLGGRALGGFQLQVTGGELLEPARVRMPVLPSALKLPGGAKPEDMAFVLTRTAEVEGIPVYEAVDSARYVDGHLETEGQLAGLRDGTLPGPSGTAESPRRLARKAFAGAAVLGIFVFQQIEDIQKAQYSVVSGKVRAPELDAAGQPVPETRQPVEGAAVFVASDETATGIAPGDRVAFTKANGFYSVPGGLAVVGRSTIVGAATSQRFPGAVAVSRTTFVPGNPRIPLDLFFKGGASDPAAAGDSQPPVVSVNHSPASPPVNQTATLRVFANDDKKLTELSVAIAEVQPLDARVPVALSDVTLTEDPGAKVSLQTIQRSYGIKATKPLTARFEVTAKDAADHANKVAYSVVFGGPQPPAGPPSDPADKTGPFVTRSVPVQDSEGVLPGQVIRLDFSEPINGLFSLYQPDQVFQLSPATGPVVARLAADKRSVELTYHALQPDTLYSLTVNPLPFDGNGNRFDQNPYNNSSSSPGSTAEAFLLRFRTAPLAPVAIPGVVNGVGVLARGRQLIVLDRVNGTQGALHLFDASDPSRPVVQSSIPVPAFPRAFTLVPSYSYRRLPDSPVETSDLVVAAGGTLGGGGQWLRVFALPAVGAPQTLVATTLSPSPAAAVTKLQWSAPHLGYLESDADTTAVGVLNLQLTILASQQSAAQFAANPPDGAPGVDANGDGDFVDVGDELPRPRGGEPRLGVINGGRVAAYVAPDPVFRLRDFDLQFGGNFVGALMSAPPSDGRSRYTTFVAGGQAVTAPSATLELTPEGKRLTLLFGQQLETPGGIIVANLALVSQHAGVATPPRLLVLDVTDPLQPKVVNEIRIPLAHGIPQTIRRRDDGLLVLSTTSDLLLLDPRKLRLVPETFAQPHPALVGLVPGFGGGAMQFVSATDGFAASAAGAVAKVAGPPGAVTITLFRPGYLGLPGRRVPAGSQAAPENLLVPVNDDNDDGDASAFGSSQSHFDNDDQVAGVKDDDLALIRLRQLPPTLGGTVAGRVELEVESVGATASAVRVFSSGGNFFGELGGVGNILRSTVTLPDAASAFDRLRTGDLDLYLEGKAPCAEVVIRLRYFGPDGALVGNSEGRLRVVRLAVQAVWSDQFAERHFNRLPDFHGDNDGQFLIMGARSDGGIYAKLRFVAEPAGVSLGYQPMFRLLALCPTPERTNAVCLLGESIVSGDVASIKTTGTQGRDYVVAGGFDQNGSGQLELPEVSVIYSKDRKTHLVGEDLSYPFAGPLVWSADLHLKVFDATTYVAKMLQYQLLAELASFGPKVWSPLVLHAFATGQPLQAPRPLSSPIPGSMAATRGPDEELEPNRGAYSHNVGVIWDADGKARIPHYILGEETDMPRQILSSPVFQSEIKQFINKQRAEIKARFSATGAAELEFRWHLHTDVQFSHYSDFCLGAPDEFTSIEGYLNGYAEFILGCADFDLFTGIGGATIILDIDARFVRETDPATGKTRFRQVGGLGPFGGVHVNGHLYDLYDWNYKEHWPDDDLATIQAGFNTLGNGGKIFSYKILLDDGIGDLDIVIE